MGKSDRRYVLCVVFACAISVFYGWPRWFHLRLPRYYPTEHAWRWENQAGVPSQGWYGLQAFAFVCSGVTTLAVYLVLKSKRTNRDGLDPRNAKRLGLAAIGVIITCMVYILMYEYSKWGILDY